MAPIEPDRSATPDGRPHGEQPRWRQDFPVDEPEATYVARRDFTRFMVVISGAFVAGQAWIGLHSLWRRRHPAPAEKAIARVDEVAVGGYKVFQYPTYEQCLLLRPDEATFEAFNQKCSHLHCPVRPAIEQGKLECPCHNGWFDLKGRPASGPPRRPLARIRLDIRDGVVYATGVEYRT
jgi:Rieske Fe-S protein